MNLPFTRFVDGKETYFPEKIIAGLVQEKIIPISKASELIRDSGYPESHPMYYIDTCREYFRTINPKFHTFRPNLKGAWKPGVMIDFMFWSGRPYWSKPVRFAPRLPVVSVQNIRISYTAIPYPPAVFVGNGLMRRLKPEEVEVLARNDGFDSISDFFKWFNKDFQGSIIHWTDLKY